MKYFTWIVLAAAIILNSGCQKFDLEKDADVFYHLRVDGVELPIWIKGNTASNKFVIFINGGPGLTSLDIARSDMLGWEERLENAVAMVYYDQRGTGNAQGTIDPATITMNQYLLDLKSIILSLKAKYPQAEVFLMGHSFGGMIGQSFLLNPENQGMIKGWINVNGSTIVDVDKEWEYRLDFLEDVAQEKFSEDPDKWGAALEWVENNNPITTDAQKEEWRGFLGDPGEGVLPTEDNNLSFGGILSIVFTSSYNIFPAYLSSNLSEVSELLFEDVKGTDLLPELYQIQLPVLTLWGKYDDIIPPQLGSAGYDSLGTSAADKRFVLFEQSGHQPFVNESELFEDEVLKFVLSY